MSTTIFERDELDLIVELACSLDASPGSNWVEEAGGLPDYICRIARAVKRTGKTTSQAVAIAVSRVKRWAAGGDDVDADTRAKAAKALAQWTALKAKSKGKKKDGKVAATATGDGFLCLAKVEYNVDIVRTAFDRQTREARATWRKTNPNAAYEDGPPYWYVRELWTSYIIVSESHYGDGKDHLYKIPYTVDAKLNVTFGEPKEVKTQYVVVDSDDMGDDVSDADLQKLLAASNPIGCGPDVWEKVMLAARRSDETDPVARLLAGMGRPTSE